MIDLRPAVRPLAAHASLALALLGTAPGHAQTAPGPAVQVPIIQVGPQGAYAADARFHSSDASFGPFGTQPILTSPASITVIPQDLLVDAQARTINDALRALPSVEIRDQQGLEVSRPQSRGFQGSITENTRLDGLRVGAINVTDTRYYSSVADGTIVGSPGANTAYLGAPRTVLASVEVDL